MRKLNQLKFIAITLLFLTTLNSCKVGRFVVYNFADINDHKKFPARNIETGTNTFLFSATTKGKVPKDLYINEKSYPFEQYLKDNKTVAFLIIQNDTIQYEKYWEKYDETSIVPSFSMAKSITSILIGCAIDDKLIQSVNEPITNYIPELKQNGFEKVTIEHLLQMTSGLKFNEGYTNPFGDVATFYYGTNLRKAISKMKLKSEPGKEFEYLSGNTQLLGLVLERALKDKTITSYLEEKIWIPLEMEFDASWSLDKKKNGLEKTFCCINARARDYAKIGRLYLNKGKWNGKQIVSEDWVMQSTKIDTTKGSVGYYQYQWWLPTQTGDFMAQGILGQYIYVHPEKNLVIVRLGKNEGKADWWEILSSLGHAY
ncbi:MAG TPA: serine hydrolase [Flavobacterium sp.]|uniref:CubicO group peptidase, beta-lactamase class C family n=1 Tax=Paenimyroides marinum TaxID=1159016 RepID=A0A1H6K407_9FLAO|nr:serine hydrolase [Paenimyroides aquimaris]SEH69850.1 CubicO group peptidase, beta-lactamase class C family [Paenimyroides aquimaris]HLV51767.1 serine hydrolase [Flavobacterium sp.]